MAPPAFDLGGLRDEKEYFADSADCNDRGRGIDLYRQWKQGRCSSGGRAVPGRVATVAQAQAVTGDTFKYSTTTPRGVRVYAIARPRAEMLRAIDSGLTELFAVARRHGYRAQLNFSDYAVFIAHADRTHDGSGAYSPDIAIGAAQYAGSIYDKGGYIYAAGMVLAYQPGTFIIAEHDRDFQRVANVARYEGEHIILYHNDPELYRKTADHSRGGSHPILQ